MNNLKPKLLLILFATLFFWNFETDLVKEKSDNAKIILTAKEWSDCLKGAAYRLSNSSVNSPINIRYQYIDGDFNQILPDSSPAIKLAPGSTSPFANDFSVCYFCFMF